MVNRCVRNKKNCKEELYKERQANIGREGRGRGVIEDRGAGGGYSFHV